MAQDALAVASVVRKQVPVAAEGEEEHPTVDTSLIGGPDVLPVGAGAGAGAGGGQYPQQGGYAPQGMYAPQGYVYQPQGAGVGLAQ